MFDYRGKTTLVTGASSGIGLVFARELAARGSSLVLVARTEAVLHTLAAELQDKYRVQVDVVPADLSTPGSAAKVSAAVAALGRQVDLLINNAGVLMWGNFELNDRAAEDAMIQLNINSLVSLTREFVPRMMERRCGGVINVASTASFQPTPYMSSYGATKAFVASFSVALWEECRHRNVHVMALCPGMTDTRLFKVSHPPIKALGAPRTSEQVVATALVGFARNRTMIVDGWKNFFLSFGPRFVPRWLTSQVAGRLLRPPERTIDQ